MQLGAKFEGRTERGKSRKLLPSFPYFFFAPFCGEAGKRCICGRQGKIAPLLEVVWSMNVCDSNEVLSTYTQWSLCNY